MVNQAVAQAGPVIALEQFHQVVFDFYRVLLLAQSESSRQPADVSVHHHPYRVIEGGSHHTVGGLAGHSG